MLPHRRQPTRLPRAWDSPGKNTGVGCHFLLQCMKVKSESEVAQSCLTLSDPMDCGPPGSSVRGIFQARVLDGVPLVVCKSLSFRFPPFREVCSFAVRFEHSLSSEPKGPPELCQWHQETQSWCVGGRQRSSLQWAPLRAWQTP